MIALSPRHACVLALALILIAIPVWYHAIVSPRTFSCSNPDALMRAKAFPMIRKFTPVSRKKHEFFDSALGTLKLPGRWQQPPQWRMTRTFELHRYYYHPAKTFVHLLPDDRVETRAVVVDGIELPIHLRTDRSQHHSEITAYLYILGGRPVRNPFGAAAAAAIPQLLEGRFPLTEILVTGISSFPDEPANRETLVDWLRSSWIRYDEICNP